MDVQAALKSQYHAALTMLKSAIERCPEDLWNDDRHPNHFWHVAYHVLFYTDFYLRPDEASFVPWEHHREDYNAMGTVPGPNPRPPRIGIPYTKDEVLAYWRLCDAMVDPAVDRMDLTARECGFRWYPMSKLEHQLANIRHVQHHAAQLGDRLRAATGAAVPWVRGQSAGLER